MFTAGEMFTALALFNQLAVCLSVFPVTLPILIKGLVSRNRSVRSHTQPSFSGSLDNNLDGKVGVRNSKEMPKCHIVTE